MTRLEWAISQLGLSPAAKTVLSVLGTCKLFLPHGSVRPILIEWIVGGKVVPPETRREYPVEDIGVLKELIDRHYICEWPNAEQEGQIVGWRERGFPGDRGTLYRCIQ